MATERPAATWCIRPHCRCTLYISQFIVRVSIICLPIITYPSVVWDLAGTARKTTNFYYLLVADSLAIWFSDNTLASVSKIALHQAQLVHVGKLSWCVTTWINSAWPSLLVVMHRYNFVIVDFMYESKSSNALSVVGRVDVSWVIYIVQPDNWLQEL